MNSEDFVINKLNEFESAMTTPEKVREDNNMNNANDIALIDLQELADKRGYAVVPKVLTNGMNALLSDEDWTWADLLATAGAVTEEDYYLIDKVESQATRIAELEAAIESQSSIIETMRTGFIAALLLYGKEYGEVSEDEFPQRWKDYLWEQMDNVPVGKIITVIDAAIATLPTPGESNNG